MTTLLQLAVHTLAELPEPSHFYWLVLWALITYCAGGLLCFVHGQAQKKRTKT